MTNLIKIIIITFFLSCCLCQLAPIPSSPCNASSTMEGCFATCFCNWCENTTECDHPSTPKICQSIWITPEKYDKCTKESMQTRGWIYFGVLIGVMIIAFGVCIIFGDRDSKESYTPMNSYNI